VKRNVSHPAVDLPSMFYDLSDNQRSKQIQLDAAEYKKSVKEAELKWTKFSWNQQIKNKLNTLFVDIVSEETSEDEKQYSIPSESGVVDGKIDAVVYIIGKYFSTLKCCSRTYFNVIEAFKVGKSAASYFHTIARLDLKAFFRSITTVYWWFA